jgi:NAD(P)-dependent dehydrogenase (short-subunit alcohol dehydrogenase family)
MGLVFLGPAAARPAAEQGGGLVAGVLMQRVGEPDEVANAIVFLASEKSSFTTGQILSIDGGKSAT